MSLTDAQLAERRAYLGGSDAPAIAGVNPPGWAQPIDVWLEKRPDLAGAQPPKRSSPLMGMGSLFEDDVLSLFTAATGIQVRRVRQPVHSRRYPWMGGHLDARAAGAIVECKWQASEKGFGPTMWQQPTEWSPGGWLEVPPVVPPHYLLQVQHYLAVTGAPVAYVGLLLGYAEFRCYRVPADYELQDTLVELERRFWHEHVLAGVPPDPDGSESYGRVIAERLAQSRELEVVATPEQANAMAVLREVQKARKAAEQRERLVKQQLQLSMGEAASLIGSGFSASYRTHEVRTVAWQAAARELASWYLGAGEAGSAAPDPQEIEELLASVAQRHTTVSTQRPFRPRWDDEEVAPDGA